MGVQNIELQPAIKQMESSCVKHTPERGWWLGFAKVSKNQRNFFILKELGLHFNLYTVKHVQNVCVSSIFFYLTKTRTVLTHLFIRKNTKLNWILEFHDEKCIWQWFQSLKVEFPTLDIKSDIYFVFTTCSSFKVQTSRPLQFLKSTSCLHLA